MPYKPKFCCQCGEKVERIEWNIFSSRRFCELCETDFKVHEYLPKIALVCGILFGFLGLWTYWQKSGDSVKNGPKQLSLTSLDSNKNSAAQIGAPQILTNQNVQTSAQPLSNSSASAKMPQTARLTSGLKSGQTETVPTVAEEKIYFCGAQTKKGSPCSRKVKGGGRCWQHPGQPAMMAQEKLFVSGKND